MIPRRLAALVIPALVVTSLVALPSVAHAALPSGTLTSPADHSTFAPGSTITLRTSATDTTGPTPGVRQVEYYLYADKGRGAPTDFSDQNPNNVEDKIRIGIATVPLSGTPQNGVYGDSWVVPTTGYVDAVVDGDHITPIPAGQTRRYTLPPGKYQIQSHMLDDEWFAAPGEPGFTQLIEVTLNTTSATPTPTPTPTPTATPTPTPTPTTSTTPPPTGNVVQANGSSFAVSGTDVVRAANALVIYTRAGGTTTTTNQWGVEVSVVNGVVTAVNDRQTNGSATTPIPPNGVVLSGHNAARTWLLANAPLGAAVALPGQPTPSPTPTTPTPTPTSTAPASNAVGINGASLVPSGTNIVRAANALVIYTRVGTQTVSPANQWGVEVAVGSDRKITEIRDRQVTAAAAMPIPTGGVVLSGHGSARDWLLANALVGRTVTLPGDVAPTPTPTGSPTVTPAIGQGRWTTLSYNIPAREIHSTVLLNGKVLLLAGSGNSAYLFGQKTFTAHVWNPATGVFKQINVPEDMFCAGHVTLRDGRVLIMGGTLSFASATDIFRGLKSSYVFDPVTETFSRANDAQDGHWYPTLTKLGNGDIWSAGGYSDDADGRGSVAAELWSDAQQRWLAANEVKQTGKYWGTYPHMFLLADGRLFYSGAHTFDAALPGTGASLFNWQTGVIQDVPGLRDKNLRDMAGSVLLPPVQSQKVAIFGGGYTDINAKATNTMDIIDLTKPTPTYTPGPNLPKAAQYINAVTLPDRTVLATGGGSATRLQDVLATEIYDPVNNAWTSVAADPIGRGYHSTAVLLPDGRVVAMGGNPADNTFEMRISVYEPGYLFKGERPTTTSAPAAMAYGASGSVGVTVPAGRTLRYVSLLAPMSATHQTDTNMRLVDVPFTQSGTTLTVTIPSNPNLAPPGPYQLVVTDSEGVPSVARTVMIGG